jgi:hypothetical protein
MALSRFVLTASVTITWPATWSEVVNQGPATPVTVPAVPATGVAAFNNAGVPVVVTVSGGTVTGISVNGTATGLTSGSVIVPAAGTITLIYSSAPAWTWAALVLSAPSPSVAQVAASAPPGGQAGPMPQVTFQPGTVIYADSSAGSSGAQQLYAAIGAGNLRAWIDGQDNVGHAALSN